MTTANTSKYKERKELRIESSGSIYSGSYDSAMRLMLNNEYARIDYGHRSGWRTSGHLPISRYIDILSKYNAELLEHPDSDLKGVIHRILADSFYRRAR